MEINQGLYPAYLGAAVLVGALLSAIYDLLRMLRIGRIGRFGVGIDAVLVFFEDILFSTLAGVFAAILDYAYNRGRFRWFSLLAMALGFWIWRMTLSRVFMSVARLLLKMANRAYSATLGRLLAFVAASIARSRQKRRTHKLLTDLIREAESGSWINRTVEK